MTQTIRIQGTLTALTPFHLTHANVSGQVDDNGSPRVLRGGTAKMPCVMTYKIPVRVAVEEGSARAMIPTIPGTSLRGRIRRAAADRIKARWIATNQQLDRESYHVLQVLSFGSQSIDRGNVRPADFTRAAEDLYAGVFGGGPGLFASSIVTPDAFAVTRETVELGILPPEAQRAGAQGAPTAWESTFAHPYIRRDDLLQFLDPLASSVVRDYAKTFQNWQELVMQNQAARAEQRKTTAKNVKAKKEGKPAEVAEASGEVVKKSGLVGQQAVEAVIPGVSFGFELSVRGNAAQCGMVIAALQDVFASDKGLGGFVRNGYGRFTAQLSMKTADASAPLLVSDGRGTAELTSDLAKGYVAEFEKALEGYTAEHFRQAYLLLESGGVA